LIATISVMQPVVEPILQPRSRNALTVARVPGTSAE
jgi:hypothetical protein